MTMENDLYCSYYGALYVDPDACHHFDGVCRACPDAVPVDADFLQYLRDEALDGSASEK